jgi:ABC-type glycerol-3-phosphate transport system substrate-binding protein
MRNFLTVLLGIVVLLGCKERFSPHITPEADADLLVAENLSAMASGNISEEPAKPGKRIVLSLNNFPPGNEPVEQDLVAQEVEMFERKYPDIRIDYSTWAFTPESFFERAKNNSLTDIVEISASQAGPIIDLHYAANLNDYAANSPSMAMLNPRVLDFLTRDGHLYGVPVELHTMAVFYNKRIFDEVMNPPPEDKKSTETKKREEEDKKKGDKEAKKGKGADALPREFLEEASQASPAEVQIAQYGYPPNYNYGYQQQEEPPPGYTNRGQREVQEYYNIPSQSRQQRRTRGGSYYQYPGYYQNQQNYQNPRQNPRGQGYQPRTRVTPVPREEEPSTPEQEAQHQKKKSTNEGRSIDEDIVTTAAEEQTTAATEMAEPKTTMVQTAKLPQDWDGLIRTAIKLTNHGTQQYGYAPTLFGEAGGREYSQWALQAGLQIEIPSGKTTQLDINTSQSGEVAQFIKDLHWKYDVTPPTDRCYSDNLMQMFAEGKIAMMMLPATRETFQQLLKLGMPVEEIGVAALPGGPENRQQLTFGRCLIINSQIDKEKREAAFKWLMFQIDPERIQLREQYYFRLQEITGIPRVPLYAPVVQARLNEDLKMYRTIPIYVDYDYIVASNLHPEPPLFTSRLYEAIADGVRPIVERQNSRPMEDIGYVAVDFEQKYLTKSANEEGLQRYLKLLTERNLF